MRRTRPRVVEAPIRCVQGFVIVADPPAIAPCLFRMEVSHVIAEIGGELASRGKSISIKGVTGEALSDRANDL